MKSNNRFAEFILSSDSSAFYNMEDSENAQAFADFFSHPVTYSIEDDQTEILKISSTLFGVNLGQFEIIPLDRADLLSKYSEKYHPGLMVQMDWLSDVMYYGNSPYVWCVPRTLELFHNLQIRVSTRHLVFDCTIRAYCDGFTKLQYSWKQDPPELWGWRVFTNDDE